MVYLMCHLWHKETLVIFAFIFVSPTRTAKDNFILSASNYF